MSLRKRIQILLAFLVGIPLLVLLFESYQAGRRTLVTELKRETLQMANLETAKMDLIFEPPRLIVEGLVRALETDPQLDAASISSLLHRTLHENADIYGVCIAFDPALTSLGRFDPYVFRKDGGESEMLDADEDYTHEDWYTLPAKSGFGKWSKPFYNSAISTFCYSAARNIELQVNDPSTYIYPVYIDDVVRSIISLALEESNSSNVNYPEISPSYKITVGELSELIHNFQDQNYLTLPDLSDGLTKALYSTYISYLPEEKFTQNLIASIDERGSFIELMKGKSFGQMSFLTCKPGFIRGEHYHNSKTEKFFIVEGDALFTFRSLRDNKTLEIFASSSKPLIVQSIPGWVHNIKNIGNKDLLALVWANEIFQKKNPDTYPCKVTK